MNDIPQTDEYKAEYAKATAELDKQEAQARGPDGKFVAKAEETPAATLPADTKVEKTPEGAPATAEASTAAPDPLAELRAEVARLDKVAKDNQAWGTRAAQELAALKREREEQARIAARPKILGANPELEDAIRYVAGVPAPAEVQQQDERVSKWRDAVEKVHPGILGADVDPELYKSLEARMQAVGPEWADPYVAIREITAGKLEHAQRQADKRLADEVAKLTKKSAMSVPGSGGTSVGSGSADSDEVARIKNMTGAQFEQERRRVLGY